MHSPFQLDRDVTPVDAIDAVPQFNLLHFFGEEKGEARQFEERLQFVSKFPNLRITFSTCESCKNINDGMHNSMHTLHSTKV
jgi:hypothetical protein